MKKDLNIPIAKARIEETPFKVCPMCGFIWATRQAFLADPGLALVGYQVNFGELMAGYFLFNHTCGTTLTIAAGEFVDLYHGAIFETRATGTAECRGYCLIKEEMRPCPAKC